MASHAHDDHGTGLARRLATVEAVAASLDLLVDQARRASPPRGRLAAAAVVAVLDRCHLTPEDLVRIERFLRLRLDGRLLPSAGR